METANHETWNTIALNKFIYTQTSELCEAHSFVLSSNRSKTLVRIKDHMIQRICQKFCVLPPEFMSTLILPLLSVTIYLQIEKFFCAKQMIL